MTDTNQQMDREQRLRIWIEEYRTPLLKVCIMYLADVQQAEDAVQETFLKAWKCMGQFEGRSGCSEKTWLTTIAINTCRSYFRTRWFRYVSVGKDLRRLASRSASMPPEEWNLFIDISRMPEKYKAVLLLYYYQQMTQQEISDALGISRSAVAHRLGKALDMLKISLGEEERI